LYRPMNCGYRAFLARFNANTGAVIAVDSLQAGCGLNVFASAGGGYVDGGTGLITADRFGNFYVGGYFDYQMWAGIANDTVTSIGGDQDWFIYKFGTANCTQPIIINTGVQQLNSSIAELKVYPNPSTGTFTFIADAAIGRLEVYNIVGEKVYTETVKGNKTTIDLSNRPAGIYIYTLHSNEGSMIKGKLIIK
jgi:hypothetical protein